MSPPKSIIPHYSILFPVLITGIFCFLEKLLTKDHPSLIQEPSHFLSNAFKNYFSFITIMLALKLVSKFAFARKSSHILPQNALKAESKMNPSQIKQAMIHFCKLMVYYTLLFGCFQFIFTLAFSFSRSSPSQALITSSRLQPSSRHLDQINEISEDLIEPEKLIPSPDLNPGSILGSIDLGPGEYGAEGVELVISKDSKTLFTLMNGTLEIFNISNPKKPLKLGSMEPLHTAYASLLLSPNENVLYMLSSGFLWVVNVTNKAAPDLIARERFEFKDSNCYRSPFDLTRDFSMLISSNGKNLFTVNCRYLRRWEISNPYHPLLMDEDEPEPNWNGPIALSKDAKRIAVGLANGFKVFNRETWRLIELKSVDKIGRVYSIAFSNDETKILIGVENSQAGRTRSFNYDLMVFDITNSPSRLVSQRLNNEASYGKLWFHANENYAFFNSKNEFKMINIFYGEQTALFSSVSDVRALPFTASLDNKINVVYFSGMVHLMKLNIDITPKSFLHFKQNSLKVIDEVDFDRRRVMEISKDGKSLFLLTINTTRPSNGKIIPYERKSSISFEKGSPSFPLEAGVYEDIDDEGQWIFIARNDSALINYIPELGSNLFLVSMADKDLMYAFVNHQFHAIFQRIAATTLTHDERNIIFVNQTDDPVSKKTTLSLNIITFSLEDYTQDDSLVNLNMPFRSCSRLSLMKTNQNDSLLFYVNCDLVVYSLANISAPVLESSMNLNISKAHAFILSKDEKTLYLLGIDSPSNSQKLLILNVSDPQSPQLLSSLSLQQAPSSSVSSESTESLELSSDETTLFIGFLRGVLMVDIRTPTQPVLFGFNYFMDQMYTPRFADNATLLYTSSYKGVTAFDFSSQYILYFKNPEFKIGDSYSILLNVFKLNKNLKFDFMMKKHKFIKVNLLEQSTTSYIALPNWATFDKERSLLKIDPNTPNTNGTYKISATLSTQTQSSAFIGLNNSVFTLEDAEDLMLDLTRSGYLDNQGYISGDLDLTQSLRIDRKYRKLEKEIKAILLKSYIQAIGEISVVSSLSLSETKPLKISTLSKNIVYVTIQLDQDNGVMPRFLTNSHSSLKPIIDNKKALLRLEGLLENVNEALKEIVVDLNGLQACSGVISINDGINPPISSRIQSLSDYLYINDKPENSLQNLQEQIDSNVFFTGLYSAIDINASTFTDKNNLMLEYSLELENPKLGLPPAWITLRGLSLMATPPETYTKFSYKFALRISNEFQSITVPFTLKVRFSFYYAIKLAATFLGYTVSLLGFIYSMNKGYNIVAKKYYRHPRSFKLKVGEEINDKNLYPISFIQSEEIKNKTLFKDLESYVRQNYNCSLLEHFIDPHSQILNQQKIIETLKLIENPQVFDSDITDTFSIGIIQQLIINRIVMNQLNSKQETKTRQVFEKIKTKWMDLVISSPSPAQFIINSENLDKELSKLSLSLKGGESLNESHFEFSQNLLQKDSLNIDLLANAFIAHAFNYQNIDIDLILIEVISYKRIRGRTLSHWIKEVLLKNLKPFVFLNKREIGCGIEYQTDGNTLHFSGRLTHELKNDTIIIHLKNNRGRILRELWIVGDNQEIQSQQNYIQNVAETL